MRPRVALQRLEVQWEALRRLRLCRRRRLPAWICAYRLGPYEIKVCAAHALLSEPPPAWSINFGHTLLAIVTTPNSFYTGRSRIIAVTPISRAMAHG